jgi:hypothetical protein
MNDMWYKVGDLVRTVTHASKDYGMGIIITVSHRRYLVSFPNNLGGPIRQWRGHNELRRL